MSDLRKANDPMRERARIVRGLPVMAAAIAALAGPGCRSTVDPGGVKSVINAGDDRVSRISWDATRRGTYVIRRGGSLLIVSEPPPDAALESILDISASLTGKSKGGDVDIKLSETVEALSRAIEISFLREALYRMSEAYANGAISQRLFEFEFGQTVSVAAMLIAAGKDETGNAIELLAKIAESRLQAIAKSDEAAALGARLEAGVERLAEETGAEPDRIRAVIRMPGPEPSEMVGLIETEGLPQGADRSAVARDLDELRALARERDRIQAQVDVLMSGLLPQVSPPR